MPKEILEEGNEDRISELPDCLILDILSRLPSTKEAIRTGTLSKRWERLWPLLPNLNFYRGYDDDTLLSDFVSFIDETLIQCRQLKLKNFEVRVDTCDYDIGFEAHVNNWLRYAISCNVEDLALWLAKARCRSRIPVNQFLFNSSCLTDLKLSGCILNPIAEVNWKNLRNLNICNGKLDEHFIEKVLSGSPLLETLELSSCYDYQMLNITSKSLKKLVLWGFMNPRMNEIDNRYDIRYRFLPQVNNWIRFAIRSNVEELKLTLWNMSIGDKLDQILFIGSCFTELSLIVQGYVFKPIGEISWKNLMNLRIFHAELDEDLIENILRGSPQLETLVLRDCYGYRRLDITSKNVKNLEFIRYKGTSDASDVHIIKINAPYILSLTIEDSLFLRKLVLVNVSSLVKANLDYEKYWPYGTSRKEGQEEMLKEFIQNLSHVKDLKIGASCSGVVSRLEAKGFVIPSNVTLSTYYD